MWWKRNHWGILVCWMYFFPFVEEFISEIENHNSVLCFQQWEVTASRPFNERGRVEKIPAPSQSCRTQSKLSFDKSDFPMVFLAISTWKMHRSPGILVQCFEDGHCCFTPEKFCVWLAGLWCMRFLAAPRTVIPCESPFSDSAVPSIKHGQQHSQGFHALIWSL